MYAVGHQRLVKVTFLDTSVINIERVCFDIFAIDIFNEPNSYSSSRETVSNRLTRYERGREWGDRGWVETKRLTYLIVPVTLTQIHFGLDLSLDDRDLRQINCFINHTYGLIVCSEGQAGMEPEHLRSHLVTKHEIFIVESNHWNSFWNHTRWCRWKHEPIDGLPIIEEKYKCLICSYHPSSWRTMRDHFGRHYRRKKAGGRARNVRCNCRSVKSWGSILASHMSNRKRLLWRTHHLLTL